MYVTSGDTDPSKMILDPRFSSLRRGTTEKHSPLLSNAQSQSNAQFNTQSNNRIPFSIDQLDLSSQVSCGLHKCFFPLLHDPTQGYVVMQEGPKRHKALLQAWYLGNFMEKALHIRQVQLQEPQQVMFTPEMIQRLQQQAHLYHNEEQESVDDDRYRPGIATVQLQRRVPTPSLLFGTSSEKKHLLWDRLEHFLREHVTNVEAFERNLQREMKESENLLDIVRCMGYDFQVFIDTEGRFHHFDIDRCFLHSEEDEEEEFMDRFYRRRGQLRNFVRKFIQQRKSSPI